MPEITLDTVLSAQTTLGEVRAKAEAYKKELAAATRRMERITNDLATAERTFAEVKSSFQASGGKLPVVSKK